MTRQPWLELDELMSADPVKGAFLSERALDGLGEPLFRFLLWRVWDQTLPLLSVGMLNPSKANAREDDPTMKRVITFAKAGGYGGVLVWNRYAYRSKNPMDLIQFGSRSAIGPNNADWIRAAIADRDVLVGWGVNLIDEEWLVEIEGLLLPHILKGRVFCLGYTAEGHPKHPLYLPTETALEPWSAERRIRRPRG